MADQGGVEFMIELQAKLDETTKMVREMNKVQAEAAKLDAAMRKAEKTTGVFNAGLRKMGASFTAVGKGVIGDFGKDFSREVTSQFTALASFEGLKRLIGGLVDLGREAVTAAGEAQRTRYSFQLLMGVEPANELLASLDKMASKTEFTDGALKGFAGTLLRAGFSGERLERAMAATIDLAAMTPDKMAGAAEGIALLSKVQLKGGVSERELVSAGIAPQKFFKEVAERTGIGLASVEKAIGAGKVKTDVLLEALYSNITAKTGKDLGGAGVGMSKTLLAQLEKVKDVVPNLFEELENTRGTESLTTGLAKLVEGFSPEGPAGKKIIAGLGQMMDRFGDLIAGVDFEAWANRIVGFTEMLTTVVELGGGLARELGEFFDVLKLFGESLGETVFEMTEMVGEFFKSASELGTAVWQGLVAGITGKVTEVVDSVKYLGKEAMGALKGVLGIHSPSSVFADYGMMTAAGFELGITRALPGVASTVAAAFAPGMLLPGPLELAPVVALGAGAAAGAAAGQVVAGGRTVHLEAHINVNIGSVGGTETDARAAGEEVASSIRRELEALLARLGAEGAAT